MTTPLCLLQGAASAATDALHTVCLPRLRALAPDVAETVALLGTIAKNHPHEARP